LLFGDKRLKKNLPKRLQIKKEEILDHKKGPTTGDYKQLFQVEFI